MKGLLLKDWYMIKSYCRSYLFIAAAFIVISLISRENMFLTFYPALLCGMIPVTMLGYDERSHWLQYSCTMPCTKKQIVTAKYLIGMFLELAVLIIIAVTQSTAMIISGSFDIAYIAVLLLMILFVSSLASSIVLPFSFKLGVEKGRLAYYVMIGVVCSFGVLASNLFNGQFDIELKPGLFFILLAAAGIGLNVLSWYLSVIFFEKREIQ